MLATQQGQIPLVAMPQSHDNPMIASLFYLQAQGLARECTGSRHIGQCHLLSVVLSSEPLLVELFWGAIAEGLMRADVFVDAVPGQEGGLQPAQDRTPCTPSPSGSPCPH